MTLRPLFKYIFCIVHFFHPRYDGSHERTFPRFRIVIAFYTFDSFLFWIFVFEHFVNDMYYIFILCSVAAYVCIEMYKVVNRDARKEYM